MEQPITMFHCTTQEAVDGIMKNGLQINQETRLTEAGAWAHKVYGVNPIYLFFKPRFTQAEDTVLVRVDTEGLALVPDLPSLVDRGAYIEAEGIWFENTPRSLQEFEDDDLISFETLLSAAASAAIAYTKSAACLSNIEVARLSRLSQRVQKTPTPNSGVIL